MTDTEVRHPSIQVLGLYSPRQSEAAFERFICQEIRQSDPANFDEETKALFVRFGRESELVPMDDEEKAALRLEIEQELGLAAVLEVLVRDCDEHFEIHRFFQSESPEKAGSGQVAWNETYLTEDGESVIAGYPLPSVPEVSCFRVVFYIHYWQPGSVMNSPYGELPLPECLPLPERLWRLAPYERLD